MKILLSLFFSLFSITISLSQSGQAKPAIMVGDVTVEGNNLVVRDLAIKTSSLLEKNFYVADKAALKLEVAAIPGKIHVINGMDSYTTSDVEVNYTIVLKGFKAQSKTITVKCKGKNERDLQRKIGTTILRNKKSRTTVIAFIDEYIASHLKDCATVTSIINQQIDENEPALSYASLAYYNLVEGCSDIAQEKENKILDAIAVKSCASLIQEAEILANGPTIAQLTKATNKLLLIGPDTPCQKDIIRISKRIADNAKNLDTQSSNNIHVKLEQTQAQSRAEWRQFYQHHYYRRH